MPKYESAFFPCFFFLTKFFKQTKEIINLGAMRPINVSKYEPTSSSFYFLMFSLENLRISLGTVMEKMQEPDADVSTLEKFKQQILLCLKYYSERYDRIVPHSY